MISAKIVADSVSVHTGARLTTFELVCPKQIVAQFNTHGMIRRDSASARAVPTIIIMEQVRDNPYKPAWKYRAPQGGMQPAGLMSDYDAGLMDEYELEMRTAVLHYVSKMEALRAAKEDINRYMEPWMWTTIVATATEWDNYFALRDHEDAQSAHGQMARLMREAMGASEPVRRNVLDGADGWHLPYIMESERSRFPLEYLPLISAARCAGVSYYRQGDVGTPERQIQRARDLVAKRHWSPTEMPCRVTASDAFSGPYRGWVPLRKFYGGESGSPHHGTQGDQTWPIP